MQKKAQRILPFSNWVLAVVLAMVTIAVGMMVVTSAWIVSTSPQEVRSQASTRNYEEMSELEKLAVVEDTGSFESPTPSTEEDADKEKEERTTTKRSTTKSATTSGNFLSDAPKGVSFVYAFAGLGVVIMGIAAGLIYLVTKWGAG